MRVAGFPSRCWGSGSGARRAPAIHSPMSAHDGVRPRPDGLNQISRSRQLAGDHGNTRARAGPCPFRLRGLMAFEATDLVVSEAVVDEGEELAGHGDAGLELAPAIGDALIV